LSWPPVATHIAALSWPTPVIGLSLWIVRRK
jgi:hypothetical protein